MLINAIILICRGVADFINLAEILYLRKHNYKALFLLGYLHHKKSQRCQCLIFPLHSYDVRDQLQGELL